MNDKTPTPAEGLHRRDRSSGSSRTLKGQTFTFWLGGDRRRRMERLKSLGIELDLSKTCQAAVDEALESGEKALGGDRLARVLSRLKRARTPGEHLASVAEAAGRAWAEDVAALSELRHVADVLEELDREHGDVTSIADHPAGAVLGAELPESDGPGVLKTFVVPVTLPETVFELVNRAGRVNTPIVVLGFLRGAAMVYRLVAPSLIAAEAAANVGELARLLGGEG